MQWKTVGNTTYIDLDPGEDELEALRALAKASFELARPNWDSLPDFIERRRKIAMTLLDEEVDRYLRLPLADNHLVLSMRLVEGRCCETHVYRESAGCFTLASGYFRTHRGDPETMLRRAQQYLNRELAISLPHPIGLAYSCMVEGAQRSGHLPTHYMFEGQSLTDRAEYFGVIRLSDESDFNLRKRLFVKLLEEGKIWVAVEFLTGCSIVEWQDYETNFLRSFLAAKEQGVIDFNELKELVGSSRFCLDPLKTRKSHLVARLCN